MWGTRVIRALWVGLATAAILGGTGCCCCGEKKLEKAPEVWRSGSNWDGAPSHLKPEQIHWKPEQFHEGTDA